jgi:hypothetical protein
VVAGGEIANADHCPIMLMIIKILVVIMAICPHFQINEIKSVRPRRLKSAETTAGGKNKGKSHYVVENTYRKNVRIWPSHYMYENK